MDEKMLTVCLPTYKREAKLHERLAELKVAIDSLNQKNFHVSVVVIENDPHSELKPDWFEVIKTKANVGAPANVIRCVEAVSDGWLWICSDDDVIHPHSLIAIFKAIRNFPQSGLLCFGRSDFEGQYFYQDADLFVPNLNTFSELISLGNCVYKLEPDFNVIPTLYHYNSSMCPQFILALECLKVNGKFVLSSEKLVAPIPTDLSEQWSYLNAFLNFSLVCNYPNLTLFESKKLNKIIWQSLPGMKVVYASLIYLDVSKSLKTGASLNLLYRISSRAPLSKKIKLVPLKFILLMPPIILKLILNIGQRCLGRKISVKLPT